MGKKGYPEPCDIDGRAVVSVSIVGTMGTDEPATPLHRIGSMGEARRTIGVCGLA